MSVYSKIQVEETRTIQIKVVYDCAEITKRSSNARINNW